MASRIRQDEPVEVVGAGLAGCECALQLARFGIRVRLHEMKPARYSPAHSLPGPAELVCSNSLKSDDPATAHGMLKWELRRLGSIVLEAADNTRVPAGSALAVDRKKFTVYVEKRLASLPEIEFLGGSEIERPPEGRVSVLCTGPLTSEPLARWLQERCGGEQLYFYDALAPIVDAESIDRSKVFEGSRWGKGEGRYLNCPMDRDQYMAFLEALRSAPQVPVRDFEPERFFEGCLPIEEMARRGDDTLAFGPMRPVGLEWKGQRPHAVVQLRPENADCTAYNLVGFQTRLTQPAQREVFRLIPGLERARFLRYGAMHRNLYIDAPRVLGERLELRAAPDVHLAGQIVGVEGYVESAAMGLLVGLWLGRQFRGLGFEPPPRTTALGALYAHVRGAPGQGRKYEPMNIHFGLFPEVRARGRMRRRAAICDRARRDFEMWLERLEETK